MMYLPLITWRWWWWFYCRRIELKLSCQEEPWRKTTWWRRWFHISSVMSTGVMDVGHTVVSTICYYGVCYCVVCYCVVCYCVCFCVLLTQRGLGVLHARVPAVYCMSQGTEPYPRPGLQLVVDLKGASGCSSGIGAWYWCYQSWLTNAGCSFLTKYGEYLKGCASKGVGFPSIQCRRVDRKATHCIVQIAQCRTMEPDDHTRMRWGRYPGTCTRWPCCRQTLPGWCDLFHSKSLFHNIT